MRQDNVTKGNDMFTLRWDGLYKPYTVVFADGWKRLNKCNAATFEEELIDLGEHNALHHRIVVNNYYLMSYASCIMQVHVMTDCDMGERHIRVYVNNIKWNCSHTTIQHISKFLKMLNYHYDTCITYQDVKAAMTSKEMQMCGVVHDGNRSFYARDDYAMTRKFATSCPDYY